MQDVLKKQSLTSITFIRLGENLEWSNTALIQHVRFSITEKDTVSLEVVARGNCQLEIWGVEAEEKAFEKIFEKKISAGENPDELTTITI